MGQDLGERKGLPTLGLVNAAVLRARGRPSSASAWVTTAVFQRGGGSTWKAQDYGRGVVVAPSLQPNKLIVLAPRTGLGDCSVPAGPFSEVPDGAVSTARSRRIRPAPASPNLRPPDGTRLPDLQPRLPCAGNDPEGEKHLDDRTSYDLLLGSRAFVARTTALSTIVTANDWITSATAEGPSVKVFQQGPDLPSPTINVVQATGGHASPFFYVGDSDASRRLWKWAAGMPAWREIVPAPAGSGPSTAIRFFVSPYAPELVRQ